MGSLDETGTVKEKRVHGSGDGQRNGGGEGKKNRYGKAGTRDGEVGE